MRCENCGNEIETGAEFCTACGNKVMPPVQPNYQPVVKNSTNEVLVAVIAVLVVALIAVAAMLVRSNSNRIAEMGERVEEIENEVANKEEGETKVVIVSPEGENPANPPETVDKTVRMTVVNCEEWISLRVSPSKQADRIIKIPLGEQVTYIADAPNGFLKVSYNGYTGYALASYLR